MCMSMSHSDPHGSREKPAANLLTLMCIALVKSVLIIRYNATHLF